MGIRAPLTLVPEPDGAPKAPGEVIPTLSLLVDFSFGRIKGFDNNVAGLPFEDMLSCLIG